MDVTFNFNKVYFIVSDELSRYAEMLFTDVVERRCSQAALFCELIDVVTKADFENTIANIVQNCQVNGVLPYIHFECHGSSEGVSLKSGECYNWDDFGDYLIRINIACKNNLFVSMASCFGGYLSLPTLKNILIGKVQRAPVCGFLGPNGEIEYNKLETGFTEYFNELLVSYDFNAAIDLLNRHSLYPQGYNINTCQYLFKHVMDDFISKNLTERFSSKVKYDSKIYELLMQRFRLTGYYPIETDFIKLTKELKDKQFYINFFNDTAKKYFMIDLYPENKSRFALIKDINNWEVLLNNVK